MTKEILAVVEVVSNEKGVAKEIIFDALEAALASATRKRHPEDVDVRVAIDRETGEYDTFRRWEVVDDDAIVMSADELPEPEVDAGSQTGGEGEEEEEEPARGTGPRPAEFSPRRDAPRVAAPAAVPPRGRPDWRAPPGHPRVCAPTRNAEPA